MTVKLLAKQHLEFLSLKEAAQACLSVHLSKCHNVGNLMSRLKTCYKGTILQRYYRKKTILWSFSYNSFVKFIAKIYTLHAEITIYSAVPL